MLQIKNVVFDKGDYAYTIEYFDGHAVRKISTNEEALQSLVIARAALANALKNYMLINEVMSCRVNSVRFGKNEESASSVQMTVWSGEKQMGVVSKIRTISKSETFPDEQLVSCNVCVNDLRGEVEKYINGGRAQQELSFDDAPEDVEDAEAQ